MITSDITRKARVLFPNKPECVNAYVLGYKKGIDKRLNTDDSFYEQLATKLHDMWPSGEKDGKWPWKESVPNLVERLRTLWDLRDLKEYTIETCISIAQRYLAQYEDNKKYMQVLKYFILKQKDIVQKNGLIKHVNESKFADMLEGKSEVDAALNEWEEILNGDSSSEMGGVLI